MCQALFWNRRKSNSKLAYFDGLWAPCFANREEKVFTSKMWKRKIYKTSKNNSGISNTRSSLVLTYEKTLGRRGSRAVIPSSLAFCIFLMREGWTRVGKWCATTALVLPPSISSAVFASSWSLSVKLSLILELRLSWVRKLGRRLGISAASMSGYFEEKQNMSKNIKERAYISNRHTHMH